MGMPDVETEDNTLAPPLGRKVAVPAHILTKFQRACDDENNAQEVDYLVSMITVIDALQTKLGTLIDMAILDLAKGQWGDFKSVINQQIHERIEEYVAERIQMGLVEMMIRERIEYMDEDDLIQRACNMAVEELVVDNMKEKLADIMFTPPSKDKEPSTSHGMAA
ncbi:unnamed protein product [Periconia digitata]|uniref:Uncharacterized protein n=1 Tax=Periconia digitata TaxID=1303443 RepID=A0A9W4XSP1_9PLEO|nr:unnamed protein product [Periconia digitata]